MALGAGITTATMASAANTPTVAQAQSEVDHYSALYDQANQKYDALEVRLTSARQRLGQIDKQLTTAKQGFSTAHSAIAQIASTEYEDSGSTSLAGLLTTNNPTQVLSAANMMLELAGNRNQQTINFLAAAKQLANTQQDQQRTEQGIQTLVDNAQAQTDAANKARQHWQAVLDSLNTQQRSQVTTSGSGGSTSGSYSGPTNTVMEKAVAYVYAQLGCPYVYAHTGPCDNGFDCSGLMYAAYQSAGLTIPRDTYEEWDGLPHISVSDIKPGDLLIYNSIGHVAMYVGNGYIIDSPHTGADVEKIPMSESWYADNFDGALEP